MPAQSTASSPAQPATPSAAREALPSSAGTTTALERLAPLTDPVRRRIYAFVAGRGEPVSRDEVARELEISRGLAAFHLEHLLRAGLLVAAPRQVGGRQRRGRPEKRYAIAPVPLELSVPHRSYELVAALFSDALASIERPASLDEAARRRGRALGRTARDETAVPRTQPRLEDATRRTLAQLGFVPRDAVDGVTCLASCPFDAVARRHRDVTCPTNLAFVDGILEGAGVRRIRARLDPAPDRCCVVLEETGRSDRVDGSARAARAEEPPAQRDRPAAEERALSRGGASAARP